MCDIKTMLFSVLFISVVIGVSQASFIQPSHELMLATNDVGHDTKYDILMDIILLELKLYLKTNHDTVISIPPVSTGFEYDVIGIPFKGYFNASGGQFTNPATINRKGDVKVTSEINNIVISMTVTFAKMQVTFSEYTASVIGISESGTVNVTVEHNAVFIEITLTFMPQCVVSVSKLEITEMSGIDANITGLGILDSIQSDIMAWILQSYRTSFTDIIEKVVQDKLQEELSKTKICKLKRSMYVKS